MTTYRTPGVYVEEISTFPPSVAQGATAVPAFIGYTERGPKEPTAVATFLEYQDLFGGAAPTGFTVDATADPPSVALEAGTNPAFLMHYALSHYFKNGGGRCYVVSVGGEGYPAAPAKADYAAGITKLEKEDEPTLIVLTDAVHLASADYHEICQSVLAQCEKLGDRFAIFDVKDGDVDAFRNGIGTSSLKYGAAYHPYLVTSMNYQYGDGDVMVTLEQPSWSLTRGDNVIEVGFTGPQGDTPSVKILVGTTDDVEFEVSGRDLTIRNIAGETGSTTAAAFDAWSGSNSGGGFAVAVAGTGDGALEVAPKSNLVAVAAPPSERLSDIKEGETANTSAYQRVKLALTGEWVTLPPSGAMAGIYARVDRERGVWKAPANESVSAVIKPTEKITHEDQERLNVDPDAGKSVNAIRAFAGQGTLVWGARTLAGNDNEWRYVPVRRLFNVIEESTRKASSFAVFEPNDATTWLKVKGMIESYLYGLWEQGALAGPTPEAAYFVNVGLGKTMTPQDVLEGRMIVEIGIAAVRPAEFIIIRFSHKMQEA
jgi:phage tail sheath protein FI